MDFLIPVLNAAQSKSCDQFTIKSEPIRSVDLMERASGALFRALLKYVNKEHRIHVYCGPGNNGGDGLCVARMLLNTGYDVHVFLCLFDKKQSEDNLVQSELFTQFAADHIKVFRKDEEVVSDKPDIIIDALFGTGLSNELSGAFKKCVEKINNTSALVFSVDIPSGLFDLHEQGNSVAVRATKTLTIQTPKPSFFYAENKVDFEIVEAGIRTDSVDTADWFLSPQEPYFTEILDALHGHEKFVHKGHFGHALLVGGNEGMHGAIALAAAACIKAGAGLTTALTPVGATEYLAKIPGAMHVEIDFANPDIPDMSKYSVLAVGPGLGKGPAELAFLRQLLKVWKRPVILDADALNLVAENPDLWELVMPESVITPHPGEFARLFGKTANGREKMQLGTEVARQKGLTILAKDTYSVLFAPDGQKYCNGSGGPWLAQGGSGDTLTGMIAGLSARLGDVQKSAMFGMYLAGLR